MEAPAALGPGRGGGRLRRHQGAIVQADPPPSPGRRVIGLDERGPVRAQTSPGEVWTEGPGRATFAPDDGRRGSLWGWGACEPATGLATTRCRPRRDSARVLQLLAPVLPTSPARAWGLITEQLNPHLARERPTAWIAWPEVTRRFIPTAACGLSRIAPWWKPWRSLALTGRRLAAVDESSEAVVQAPASGNAHRYP